MFQDPEGYTLQMFEVHLQYWNSAIKWRFIHFFRLNSTLYLSFLFVNIGNKNDISPKIAKWCLRIYVKNAWQKLCMSITTHGKILIWEKLLMAKYNNDTWKKFIMAKLLMTKTTWSKSYAYQKRHLSKFVYGTTTQGKN